jgi:hypothetical protein
MATYCADHGVLLAPHGKTTMSPQLFRRQLAAGAWAVTAATAWQASAMTEMGVRRIVLANEVVDPGSVRLLGELLTRYPDLDLWCYADSPRLSPLSSAFLAYGYWWSSACRVAAPACATTPMRWHSPGARPPGRPPSPEWPRSRRHRRRCALRRAGPGQRPASPGGLRRGCSV